MLPSRSVFLYCRASGNVVGGVLRQTPHGLSIIYLLLIDLECRNDGTWPNKNTDRGRLLILQQQC